MASTFRFLDNVALADCAFEATGDSLTELFQAAGQAVIETLANPATVHGSWNRIVEQCGQDPSTLLFDYLSEIVYLKDAEGVVFSEAVPEVWQDENGVWHLHARLAGAPVALREQDLRADVKGVTKHLYDVRQDGSLWKVTVVLDI